MKKIPKDFFNIMRIALLGNIYPSIRAIAFEYQSNSKKEYLKLRFYYDKDITDFDREHTEIIATQIDAMMKLDRFEIEHIFSKEKAGVLDHLDGWLYFRYEE